MIRSAAFPMTGTAAPVATAVRFKAGRRRTVTARSITEIGVTRVTITTTETIAVAEAVAATEAIVVA